MLDDIRTFMVPVSPLPHPLLDLHLQCFYLFSLQDADLSIEDIGEVVLVGGSSRIPIVQRLSLFMAPTDKGCHNPPDPFGTLIGRVP
jgi:hypothetical protein